MSDPPSQDHDAPRPSNDDVVPVPPAVAPAHRPWWTWPLLLLSTLSLALAGLVASRGLDDGSHDPAVTSSRRHAVSASKPLRSGADDADSGADGSAPLALADLPAVTDADEDEDAADAGADGGDGEDRLEDGGDGGGGHDAGKAGPARSHVQEGAVHWRVASASASVARSDERGGRFDVVLHPGKTFDGLRVEWQDARGTWHPH